MNDNQINNDQMNYDYDNIKHNGNNILLTVLTIDHFPYIIKTSLDQSVHVIEQYLSRLEGVYVELCDLSNITRWDPSSDNTFADIISKNSSGTTFKCNITFNSRCPTCYNKNILGYGRILDPRYKTGSISISGLNSLKDYDGNVLYVCCRKWLCGKCWIKHNYNDLKKKFIKFKKSHKSHIIPQLQKNI